jgi:predicted nucleic acid-binding Zn ribbon protein
MKQSKILEKEQRKSTIINVIIYVIMFILLYVHLTSTTVEMV